MPQEPRPGPYAGCLALVPPYETLWESEHAPHRIDARWRRAGHLAAGGRLDPRYRDGWTDQAARFLAALAACSGEADRQRLSGEMPDFDAAYRLRHGDDRLARGLLEARLLGGQGFADAAARCGLSAAAVEFYHQVFFDVQGHLSARVFLLTEAVGTKAFDGMTEEDVDVFVKRFGLIKGPLFVDVLERYLRGGWSVPARLEGQSKEALEELRLMLDARALFLACVLPGLKQQRVELLTDLLDELDGLIDSWPEPGSEGPPLGLFCLPEADRRRWWAQWRRLAVAASTGRGMKRARRGAGAA